MPPSACSNLPIAPRGRARERALLVAEQLGLDQVLRDRRAVHLHEGRRRARAALVQRARHQLLAGPVLAGDEHARVGRRGARDLGAQASAMAGLDPDEPRLRARARDSSRLRRRSRAGLQRVAHRDQEPLRVERLLQVVEGAELRGLHRRLHGGLARHHDRPARPRRAARIFSSASRPVMPGSITSSSTRSGALLAHARQARPRRPATDDGPVALVAQQAGELQADVLLVVDDQDASHAGPAPWGACPSVTPDPPARERDDAAGSCRAARRALTPVPAPPSCRIYRGPLGAVREGGGSGSGNRD